MNKHNSDWTLEDTQEEILQTMIRSLINEDDKVNICRILADYFNHADKEGIPDDEADDIFNLAHEVASKPRWLNLTKAERIIKAALQFEAAKQTKELTF